MIKRYDMDGSCECGRMGDDVEYEDSKGQWVRFDDMVELLRRVEEVLTVGLYADTVQDLLTDIRAEIGEEA